FPSRRRHTRCYRDWSSDRVLFRSNASEILFRGADRGRPKELAHDIAFERSLALDDALADGVLVAYAMNGAPLAPEHGAPWRLVRSEERRVGQERTCRPWR